MSESDAVRPEIVSTAVKFLRNPRVQATPLDQQRQFLVKKGLTESEVSAALAEAGSAAGLPGPPLPPPIARPSQPAWLSTANAVLVVGGGSYALYRLLRAYILPTFFGIANPEAERLQRMEDQLSEVSNSLKFVMDSMQQSLNLLQGQQANLQRALTVLADNRERTGVATKADLAELQAEIAVLKSLLLSRNQFAAVPQHDALPAWQKPRKSPTLSDDSGEEIPPANAGANGSANGTANGIANPLLAPSISATEA